MQLILKSGSFWDTVARGKISKFAFQVCVPLQIGWLCRFGAIFGVKHGNVAEIYIVSDNAPLGLNGCTWNKGGFCGLNGLTSKHFQRGAEVCQTAVQRRLKVLMFSSAKGVRVFKRSLPKIYVWSTHTSTHTHTPMYTHHSLLSSPRHQTSDLY